MVAFLAACAREQATPARPKSQSTAKTTSARRQEERRANAEVGDVMPAYSSQYLDGKPFDLKAQKGHVVLLNVWATWCAPCRYEIPELQTLYEKYRGRGFEVVGVSVDDVGVDAVKQFVTENKITYPIALDSDGRVANILRTTVLPTSVMIDRDGRIVWRKIGAVMPNETAALDALVLRTVTKKS